MCSLSVVLIVLLQRHLNVFKIRYQKVFNLICTGCLSPPRGGLVLGRITDIGKNSSTWKIYIYIGLNGIQIDKSNRKISVIEYPWNNWSILKVYVTTFSSCCTIRVVWTFLHRAPYWWRDMAVSVTSNYEYRKLIMCVWLDVANWLVNILCVKYVHVFLFVKQAR